MRRKRRRRGKRKRSRATWRWGAPCGRAIAEGSRSHGVQKSICSSGDLFRRGRNAAEFFALDYLSGARVRRPSRSAHKKKPRVFTRGSKLKRIFGVGLRSGDGGVL